MRISFVSLVLSFVMTSFSVSAAPSAPSAVPSRYSAIPSRYSDQIQTVSLQYGLNPRFVQAVIWRESRFNASAKGKNGEIGLMQLKMNTVRDWAKAHRRPVPSASSVYDPEMNLHIGIWRLDQALRHWEGYEDQIQLALFEYNAGRKAILRRLAHCGGDIPLLLRSYHAGSYATEILDKYAEYSSLDKPSMELAQF